MAYHRLLTPMLSVLGVGFDLPFVVRNVRVGQIGVAFNLDSARTADLRGLLKGLAARKAA